MITDRLEDAQINAKFVVLTFCGQLKKGHADSTALMEMFDSGVLTALERKELIEVLDWLIFYVVTKRRELPMDLIMEVCKNGENTFNFDEIGNYLRDIQKHMDQRNIAKLYCEIDQYYRLRGNRQLRTTMISKLDSKIYEVPAVTQGLLRNLRTYKGGSFRKTPDRVRPGDVSNIPPARTRPFEEKEQPEKKEGGFFGLFGGGKAKK
jgi:hypothetical protein